MDCRKTLTPDDYRSATYTQIKDGDEGEILITPWVRTGHGNHGNRIGMAKWLACPPLTRYVPVSRPGLVIPMTNIMVLTASQHGMYALR